MRTTKPISTISFNTPSYLAHKLEELRKAGRISFWAFIQHKPEDDEGGRKYHCHVYVEPSKMLQTDDLKEALKEFDPEKPDKPLGCISWVSSKFDNWYMYALHDSKYLASKQQSRRFSYSHGDFAASDEDDLLFKARSINLLSLSPYAAMEEAISLGIKWEEFFARGSVPVQQVMLWREAWFILLRMHQGNALTDRNGREGHIADLPLDTETGELLPFDDPLLNLEEIGEETASSSQAQDDDELPFIAPWS